jgi:urocanate hydratase
MGLSLHAGQVCVADGTPEAGKRIRRTLLADPGMGIVRHVDAGYPEAIDAAERLGVRIPMAPTAPFRPGDGQ